MAKHTDYTRRIESIRDQVQILYADMFDEPLDGTRKQRTDAFVRNLEDAIYQIDGALDEFRRQIEIEKGEAA